MAAHHNKNVDVVKFLVSQVTDVKVKSEYATELLHRIVEGRDSFLVEGRYCNVDLVKFFVANGADVNAKNRFGNTPLDTAKKQDVWSGKSNTVVVKYLESVVAKSNE